MTTVLRGLRGPVCGRACTTSDKARGITYQPPLVVTSTAGGPAFRPAACAYDTRGANLRSQTGHPMGWLGGATRCVTPRQACPQPNGLGRNLRSKTRWFTGFCNSHQVSHFATFFIDARAEISVAESRFEIGVLTTPRNTDGEAKARPFRFRFPWRRSRRVRCLVGSARLPPPERRATCRGPGQRTHGKTTARSTRRGREIGARTPPPPLGVVSQVRGSFCWAGFDNDPSAGSPTETLLRLLLPLNDKVQWTSRDVGGGEPPPSPRSEHFTGPFNR